MRSYAKCCKVQVASSCLSEPFWILLHIVMQSWGFPPSRGLLSEECSIHRATHPRHTWQKPETTIMVSLSCIKCVLMCSESLPIKQIPQIPPSPSLNKLPALKGGLSWFLSIIVFIYTECRPANTGITFKQSYVKDSVHTVLVIFKLLTHTVFCLYSRCHFPEENKEMWSEIAVFNW